MLFSLWLMPNKETRKTFNNIIEDLSRKYEAPSFESHSTLFCGETKDENQFIAACSQTFKTQSEITLETTSLADSDAFYKTVYLEMALNPTINTLFAACKKNLDPESQYQLKPHLSFIYQHLTPAIRADVKREVELKIKAIRTLTFDRIAVMTDTLEESPEAVKSWTEIATFPLRTQTAMANE